MKRILSLLLLFPFALNAGPVLSVLDPYPSAVKIEATVKCKKQYPTDNLPQEGAYTSYLPLEKSFFSLQERTRLFVISASSSYLYTTKLALINVTRNGIYLTCTVQNERETYYKETWPMTIPFDKNFEETTELDLLDDAREKIKVTIKSTITE
jgi:hypothetical protein